MAENDCKKKCKQHTYVPSLLQKKIIGVAVQNINNGFPTITTKEVKEQLKLTDRQVYYNLNKLIKDSYFKNEENSIYLLSLTPKGISFAQTIFGDLQFYGQSVLRFLDRQHKTSIMAEIIYRPEQVVPAGFKASEKSKKLHWKYPVLTSVDKEGRITIQITDKTISISFHEMYGIDPHHLVHTALNRCVGIFNSLREQGFKVGMPNYTVVSQHHAIFNETLAKFSAKYDIHWKSDRLEFDHSVSPNEFELIHPEQSPDDFVKLVELLEYAVRGKISAEALSKLCSILPDLQSLLQNKHNTEENVK